MAPLPGAEGSMIRTKGGVWIILDQPHTPAEIHLRRKRERAAGIPQLILLWCGPNALWVLGHDFPYLASEPGLLSSFDLHLLIPGPLLIGSDRLREIITITDAAMVKLKLLDDPDGLVEIDPG